MEKRFNYMRCVECHLGKINTVKSKEESNELKEEIEKAKLYTLKIQKTFRQQLYY
jgi:hypothetical protein